MNCKKVMVFAPHPDDETLGCAGTLMKLQDQGAKLTWVIITSPFQPKYVKEQIETSNSQVGEVASRYDFNKVYKLGFKTTEMDKYSMNDILDKVIDVLNKEQPDTIFVPFLNDVHTDHGCIARAVVSCLKKFRFPYIMNALYYETISETEQNFDSTKNPYTPNVFVDISNYIDKKLDIASLYKSEMGVSPFPRSKEAIIAQNQYRGIQNNCKFAESFQLMKMSF